MLIKKRQISKKIFFLLPLFFIILIYLFIITPGLRGDIEQSLRIILNEPVLFKSKQIKSNKLKDYSSKIYNAFEKNQIITIKIKKIILVEKICIAP